MLKDGVFFVCDPEPNAPERKIPFEKFRLKDMREGRAEVIVNPEVLVVSKAG